VAATRGADDGGGARVAARAQLRAKLMWEACGRCTGAYIGV
jgi:hypothetical protein